MHLRSTLALTDWLKGKGPGAGKGVNDFLPTVPRELDLDPQPPKRVDFIGDAFRDDRVAELDDPTTPRAIYVMPDGPVTKEGEAHTAVRDARSVVLAIRIIVKEPGKAASQRWAAYCTHAVERSIAAFLDETAAARQARARGSIQIQSANAITAGPWFEQIGESMALGVVAIDLAVRDTQPR